MIMGYSLLFIAASVLLLFTSAKYLLPSMTWDIYGVSFDVVLGIVIGVIGAVIAGVGIWFAKNADTFLKAIIINQIYEKTAMIYNYIPNVEGWKIMKSVEPEKLQFVIGRIQSDILSLKNMAKREKEECANLHTAFTILIDKMKSNELETESSILQAAFDSLKI